MGYEGLQDCGGCGMRVVMGEGGSLTGMLVQGEAALIFEPVMACLTSRLLRPLLTICSLDSMNNF